MSSSTGPNPKRHESVLREGAGRGTPEEPDASRPAGRDSRLRRWGFRLVAALVIPILFFASVEMVLRITGTGYPVGFLHPSTAKPGYLADNYRFAWRFFPRSLARSSQPILLVKEKPPGTKRVIVFGGSAAMGDPEPAYGFPRVLEVLLELRYPAHDFEVINAAITAVNSHVVLPVVKDCRELDADAWVIYMGHNEVHGPFGAGTVFGGRDTPLRLIRFGLALQRTKTGQLVAGLWKDGNRSVPESWGGMKMFLDHQVRHDDPSLGRVYDHFGRNLGDILDTAIARGTPVVISTLVSNLRNCPPFASLHARSISAEQSSRWQTLFQRGCAAQSEGKSDQAIEAFDEAARIDPQFAELQFRLGECYLRLDEPRLARERFQQARDQDTLRFRASGKINEIIVSTALERSEDGVQLIEATGQFAQRSPDGIPGEEFLNEHVHFNFAGNYLLAKLFAEKLAGVLNLAPEGTPSDEWPSDDVCAERLGLTPYHRLLVLRELETRFGLAPFTEQLNHRQRDAKLQAEISALTGALTEETAQAAIEQYRQLLELDPGDWVLRKQFAALLESTGDFQGAMDEWTGITNQLPHYSEGFYKLGTLLNRTKKWSQAEQALRAALALRPDYARASNSLGISLSHQDRPEESYHQFAQAIELNPGYAEAHVNWGLVLASQGDFDAALKRYTLALRADVDYLPAHLRLGEYYVGREQYAAAEPHYSEVVRLKPNDVAAHLNLGLLLLKKNECDKAIHHIERALQLDPANRLARQALAQARQMGGGR